MFELDTFPSHILSETCRVGYGDLLRFSRDSWKFGYYLMIYITLMLLSNFFHDKCFQISAYHAKKLSRSLGDADTEDLTKATPQKLHKKHPDNPKHPSHE